MGSPKLSESIPVQHCSAMFYINSIRFSRNPIAILESYYCTPAFNRNPVALLKYLYSTPAPEFPSVAVVGAAACFPIAS